MDIIDRITAVLESRVLPAIIARGGDIHVRSVENGVVLLSMEGSPGAVLPLIARIELLLRTAVPGITGVRLVEDDGDAAGDKADTDLAERVRQLLDREINPTIAAHGGHVVLEGLDAGWARLRLEGGCQGCSLAEVTLRQGIEPLLRARIPDLIGVIDVTDHEAGTTPFFSPAKR